MNKTAAPAGLANLLSIAPASASQGQAGTLDGVSFASIFPAQLPAPATGTGGNPLPATGNQLPLQTTAPAAQGQALPAVQPVPETVLTPAVTQPVPETVLTPAAAQPVPEAVVTPGAAQPVPETIVTQATAQPGIEAAPTTAEPPAIVEHPPVTAGSAVIDAVRSLTAASGTAQAVAATQASLPGEPQATTTDVRMLPAGGTQTVELPARETLAATQPQPSATQPAPQLQPPAPAADGTALRETLPAVTGQPALPAGPGANEDIHRPVSMAAESSGSPRQFIETPAMHAQAHPAREGMPQPPLNPAGPQVPTQATSGPVSEQPPLPAAVHTEVRGLNISADEPRTLQQPVAAQGAVAGEIQRAVNQSQSADDARSRGLDREAVYAAMQRVNQAAPAGQAGDTDLQQFLQEHRDQQAAANSLTRLSHSGSNFLASLQNITDTTSSLLPSARVPVPVGQPGWDRAVGQQLAMFISQDVSAAKLRLNPQHLGPVEMQISIDGDRANVAFLSQHSVVREALESSLPRLREMLADSGLNLVNVNVSQQGTSGQGGRGMNESQQDPESFPLLDAGNGDEHTQEITAAPDIPLGLIDAYA